MWKAIVRERIEREGPMPDGAADREQLSPPRDARPPRRATDAGGNHRVCRRQFAGCTGSALVNRIAPRVAPFAGDLPAGETTFRVTAADPDAAKKPRVATGPGRYVIGDHVRLVIVRRPDGEHRVNEANIMFFAPDPKAEPPGKPHEIKLPDGLLTWAIGWERGSTVLWVAEKDVLRSYDFTTPAQVKETRIETASIDDVPEPLREALRAALEGGGNAGAAGRRAGIRWGEDATPKST